MTLQPKKYLGRYYKLHNVYFFFFFLALTSGMVEGSLKISGLQITNKIQASTRSKFYTSNLLDYQMFNKRKNPQL